MRLPRCSVNQKLLSGPIVMIRGALPGFGSSNSLMAVPSGAMRPIRLPACSVNHKVPSGARAIVVGPPPGVGKENSVALPSVFGDGCATMRIASRHRHAPTTGRARDIGRHDILVD